MPFLLLASVKRWEGPFFTKAPGSSLTDKKSVVVYCCIVRLYPRKTAAGSSSGGNLRKNGMTQRAALYERIARKPGVVILFIA